MRQTQIIFEMDVWSLGMTLAEVATQNSPLKVMFAQLQKQGQTHQQASQAVMSWVANTREAPIFQTDGMDVGFQNLLYKSMLVLDISSRRQLAECMNHDFFRVADTLQHASQSCEQAKPTYSPARPIVDLTGRVPEQAKPTYSPTRPSQASPRTPKASPRLPNASPRLPMESPRPIVNQTGQPNQPAQSPRPLPSPKPAASNSEPSVFKPTWVREPKEPQKIHGSRGNGNAPKSNTTYQGIEMVANTHHHLPWESPGEVFVKESADLGEVFAKNRVFPDAQEMRPKTENQKHQQHPSSSQYLLPSWTRNAQEMSTKAEQQKHQPQQSNSGYLLTGRNLPTLLEARQGWVLRK